METLTSILLPLFLIRLISAFSLKNDIIDLCDDFEDWFDAKIILIVDDYLNGKHLFYKWLITIMGLVIIIYWIVKGLIYLVTSVWFWVILGSICVVGGVIIFLIGRNREKGSKPSSGDIMDNTNGEISEMNPLDSEDDSEDEYEDEYEEEQEAEMS